MQYLSFSSSTLLKMTEFHSSLYKKPYTISLSICPPIDTLVDSLSQLFPTVLQEDWECK